MQTRTHSLIPISLLLAAALALAAQEPDGDEAPAPTDVGASDAGVRFELPAGQRLEVPAARPLSVERFEVHELAEGTALGKPGDLLVTFFGSGFLLTARTPRLRLSDEVVLETTEIGRQGSELYVVVPREQIEAIAGMAFTEVVVENPGHWKEGQGTARVEATPDRLLRPAADAAPVRVVYRDGAFARADRQEP